VSDTRQEVEATIAARRELGQDHEPELIDAFLDRLERRLGERVKAPVAERSDEQRRQQFVLALASLGIGIPITAISASIAGLAGLLVAWAGIVLVNLAFARQR
jgi:hypothetical protein